MTNFARVTSPESTLTEIAQKAIRVFMYAAAALTTRDMTEEYMAARVVPLKPGWRPMSVRYYGTPGQSLGYPIFGLTKEGEFKGKSDEEIVALVEAEAVDVVGPYVQREYEGAKKISEANMRLNRVFAEMGVQYSPHPVLTVKDSMGKAEKRRRGRAAGGGRRRRSRRWRRLSLRCLKYLKRRRTWRKRRERKWRGRRKKKRRRRWRKKKKRQRKRWKRRRRRKRGRKRWETGRRSRNPRMRRSFHLPRRLRQWR